MRAIAVAESIGIHLYEGRRPLQLPVHEVAPSQAESLASEVRQASVIWAGARFHTTRERCRAGCRYRNYSLITSECNVWFALDRQEIRLKDSFLGHDFNEFDTEIDTIRVSGDGVCVTLGFRGQNE